MGVLHFDHAWHHVAQAYRRIFQERSWHRRNDEFCRFQLANVDCRTLSTAFRGDEQKHYTLWGYGLFIDNKGDYVKKPMARCTGKEILTELIHQLGFEDIMEEVLVSTEVTSVMLPYASAMFACRVPEDRPRVIPKGAGNFAFLGEWVELPEDIVYTVEYSVHTGMHAVYNLFGVEKRIPLPAYHDLLDPKAGFSALESIFK